MRPSPQLPLALFGALSYSLVAAAWQKLYNLTLDTLPSTYLIVVTILMLITIPTNLIMKKLVETKRCNILIKRSLTGIPMDLFMIMLHHFVSNFFISGVEIDMPLR